MQAYPSRHISVTINAAASRVYDFASDPANLPLWAAGLGSAVRQSGDEWIAESPVGAVRVKFAGKNPYGVLDHEVTLPSGETVYNPLRIFPNGNGCEAVFTLFRLPGMTDLQFARDADMVSADLARLKSLSENR